MKVVALLSGGKDSVLALHLAAALEHEVIAVAHLSPRGGADETDSYMYQSVGSNLARAVGECLLPGVSFYTREISGLPVQVATNEYTETVDDEVEDLFELLKEVKHYHPQLEAVVSGAIFSRYQKGRVEAICQRIGVISFAPLWFWPQSFLLGHLTSYWKPAEFDVRLLKVATLGLTHDHLLRSLHEVRADLVDANRKYGINVCGEGGEFETVVLSAPGYRHSIRLHNVETLGDPLSRKDGTWYVKAEYVEEPLIEECRGSTFSERVAFNSKLSRLSEYFLSLQFYEDDVGMTITDYHISSSACDSHCRRKQVDRDAMKSTCRDIGTSVSSHEHAIGTRLASTVGGGIWRQTRRNMSHSSSLFAPLNPFTHEVAQVWTSDKGGEALVLCEMHGYIPHAAPGVTPRQIIPCRRQAIYMELLLLWRTVRNTIVEATFPHSYRLQVIIGTLDISEASEITNDEARHFTHEFWKQNWDWKSDSMVAFKRWKFLFGDEAHLHDLAKALAIEDQDSEPLASPDLMITISRVQATTEFCFRDGIVKYTTL